MKSPILFFVILFLSTTSVLSGTLTYRDTSILSWDTVKQFAGYVDVDDNKNSLFYWFFESRSNPDKDPIMLWLNGGPGCSSLKGTTWVNGPGIIQADLSHTYNPYSWNSNSSIIFLDQPAGTGFSVCNDDVSSDNVAIGRQIYEFLSTFFQSFPNYKTLPLHIVGQSDAGHYLADIAAEIVSHSNRTFTLTSLVIGNGLINSQLQYQYVQPMFCGSGGVPPVISPDACSQMDVDTPLCIEQIDKCHDHVYKDCSQALDYCDSVTLDKFTGNYFNIEQPCDNLTTQCYARDTYYVEYLNQPAVLKALGSRKNVFQACNTTIATNFGASGAQLASGDSNLTTILNGGIPLLIFAGDLDGTYNWLGNQAVAKSLDWPGQSQFFATAPSNLTIHGRVIGEVTNHGFLTFARVMKAGHLVSWDQPEVALALINDWMSGDWPLNNLKS